MTYFLIMQQTEVEHRRDKVSQLLAKSVTKPADIAKSLGVEITDVYSDLKFLKKNSNEWLNGFANDGYVFVTKQTIDSLYDIEVELQKLRQDAKGADNKLKIIKELRETINTRWVIQGNGPTLMAIKKAQSTEKD